MRSCHPNPRRQRLVVPERPDAIGHRECHVELADQTLPQRLLLLASPCSEGDPSAGENVAFHRLWTGHMCEDNRADFGRSPNRESPKSKSLPQKPVSTVTLCTVSTGDSTRDS